MSVDIKNFDELIKSYLKPGQKFVSYECDNLLQTGENYGSVMLKISVKIRNENGKEEILQCVGKTFPPSVFLRGLFNSIVTFKKEIAVYTTIIPALNKFGKERGINRLVNFVAEPLGARISLESESEFADENAILLLENLDIQGYEIGDRFNGFDEETTKYLLRDLAVLHAGIIAYRCAKPGEFKIKMLPHLNKDFLFKFGDDMLNKKIKSILNTAAQNPLCVPYLSQVETAIRNAEIAEEHSTIGKEIFVTFIHNDYWVNNTMLKYENNKIVNNKMVDFQVIEYSSLAHDVIFFLYISTKLQVLEEKADELFLWYYNNFIDVLVKLQHDTDGYTFASMMEEFTFIAKHAQFVHLLFMAMPIMTLKDKATDLSEFTESDCLMEESRLHENYSERVQFIISDFAKRGWIL